MFCILLLWILWNNKFEKEKFKKKFFFYVLKDADLDSRWDRKEFLKNYFIMYENSIWYLLVSSTIRKSSCKSQKITKNQNFVFELIQSRHPNSASRFMWEKFSELWQEMLIKTNCHKKNVSEGFSNAKNDVTYYSNAAQVTIKFSFMVSRSKNYFC